MKKGIHMMKQFVFYMKRNYIILLAFFLPPLILETAYIVNGIYPFGNRDILIIDLYHQYAPFISDLQDKLRSFSSLLYSWSGGLGISYLPIYAYYLASPLNFIAVLFPKEYLTEAVLMLTLLKVGLSGACFAFYLTGVYGEKSLFMAAFSMLYALSGYVLAFSWNIMWMDAIYLLPLIMLGLVKLIRDGRGLFFCITLAIALITNFYMGFFICFFTLLYYPVCLFKYHNLEEPRLLIKRTAQFAGFSLLSAGLSAVLLLPTYFQLKLTSAAGDKFPKTLSNYFDLFDYITRNFTAASPSIREGAPNLYCGIVVLILLPVYFLSRSINLKEKLWNLTLIIVLILSFNMNILNFIWHGFHYPNQIPYRFSFVCIFLVLSVSYEAYKMLNEFRGKQIGAICMAVLGLVVISQKFDDLSIGFFAVYASAAFVILYAAALTIDKSLNILPSCKALLLFFVVAAELMTNTIATSFKIGSIEGYSIRDKYASGREVAQIRDEISDIAAKDNGFYRLEILPTQTCNDPALYNYRGLSIFSSTASVKPVKMLKNLGYSSNGINSLGYKGSTVILDSLLGIKYLIYRSMNIDDKLYRQIAAADELKTFINPYVLPIGFQASDGLKKFNSSYSGSNPFETQNFLMEYICGISNILLPIDQKPGNCDNLSFSSQGTKYYSFSRTDKDIDSTARVRFTIADSEQVYLYYKAPLNVNGSGFVMVNDKRVEFNLKDSSIINLGFCESGTSAEMQLIFNKSSAEKGRFEIYAYGLNLPAFEDAISKIQGRSMMVESFTDTGIRGRMETTSDGLMVMSVPFDRGWHVKVDNREVKTQAVDDCLLCFELLKGAHKIELMYYPEGLFTGLIITLSSAIILILFVVNNKRGRHCGL